MPIQWHGQRCTGNPEVPFLWSGQSLSGTRTSPEPPAEITLVKGSVDFQLRRQAKALRDANRALTRNFHDRVMDCRRSNFSSVLIQ
jgi:hypothetical protein